MAHVVVNGKKSTTQFVNGLMTGGSYTTNTSNEVIRLKGDKRI